MDRYPHLRFSREEPVNQRRSRPAPIRPPEPSDPRAFGEALKRSLDLARVHAADDIGGFDERPLIKLELSTPLDPHQLQHISRDIEIVSQEEKGVVLAFATEAALGEFESRLTSLIEGGRVTYRNLVYALKGFDSWTEEDRTGWSLRQEGWPEAGTFLLDVELWPISQPKDRDSSWTAFETWLVRHGVEQVDAVKQPHLTLYRLRVTPSQGALLLRHRDVRLVDLPPRYALEASLLRTDTQDLPAVSEPPANAPGIALLDSGVTTGHPLLAPAVGDAQSFVPGLGPEDENGHGTLVAGVALYGDVEQAVRNGRFIASAWLLSGRVLNANCDGDERLLENQVDDAVRYFFEHYGCRVFTLSVGDKRRPYRGRHVRGLAVTLDSLARELGVLFILPTGNYEGSGSTPTDWLADYPSYLLSEDATLLDPAPALNALTVGSIARWDASFNAQRYCNDPAEQPIARHGQPSPFTRHGPSVGGAVKPEVVAYGGNWARNLRASNQWIVRQGLGELSTSRDLAAGRPFGEDAGTSFAAPHLAHLAARILTEYPDADQNLLRALLVAHARWPESCQLLLPDKADRLRLCGYGEVDSETLERSNEQGVSLLAADALQDRHHHFYEVPLPESFLAQGRRSREISVALAHTPAVRTTRVSYKCTRLEFRLVWAESLEHVSTMFDATTSRDAYERISEWNGARIGTSNRGAATVQADTWIVRSPSPQQRTRRLFVVVTRIDENWGQELTMSEEPYVLVVALRDRENAEAQLYTQIQARLRIRPTVRVRA